MRIPTALISFWGGFPIPPNLLHGRLLKIQTAPNKWPGFISKPNFTPVGVMPVLLLLLFFFVLKGSLIKFDYV